MSSLVIKISGEYFSTPSEGILSERRASVLSKALRKIEKQFSHIYIIVGGGNFLRGREQTKTKVPRHIYDEIAMNATAINSQWLSWYLKESGHSAIALTTGTNTFIKNFSQHFTNLDRIEETTPPQIIVIGGGTGMPYLSTDTLAIITALRTSSPLILFAKHGIDGVYTSDPTKNKDAKFIRKTTFDDIIRKRLNFMDLSAITIALDKPLSFKVFRFKGDNDLVDVIKGNLKHTFIN